MARASSASRHARGVASSAVTPYPIPHLSTAYHSGGGPSNFPDETNFYAAPDATVAGRSGI
ncbi:MAG: hypothetical protein M3Q03_13360 [Chloroflexota bacterium]|nr:hypothetical protein [Chloroflexota bacterium]